PRQPAPAHPPDRLASAGQARERRAPRTAGGGRMKHGVVVEDDPINAALVRVLLERRGGCRVTVSESAEEVLRLAREGVDAIVMDISLKGSTYQGRPVTGVDVCRMLKASPETAAIRVVLATAHRSVEH